MHRRNKEIDHFCVMYNYEKFFQSRATGTDVVDDVEADAQPMERKPDKMVTVLIDNANEKIVCERCHRARIGHVDLKDLEGRRSFEKQLRASHPCVSRVSGAGSQGEGAQRCQTVRFRTSSTKRRHILHRDIESASTTRSRINIRKLANAGERLSRLSSFTFLTLLLIIDQTPSFVTLRHPAKWRCSSRERH